MKEISTMTATSSAIQLDVPILDTRTPLLKATGLTKRYGQIVAVDKVDIEVYPGEVLGIVGESGSGKSTVLRLLNLQEMPDAGDYTLDLTGLAGRNLFDLEKFQR